MSNGIFTGPAVTSQTAFFAPTPNRRHLDWYAISETEPALASLERELRHAQPRKRHCWKRWKGIKARLSCYVGWHARNPALRSSEAYEIVCSRLLDIFEGRDVRK